MKIEIYIEDGAPLLVFPKDIQRDKTMVCYSVREGHSNASRGYLRTLAMPETAEEIKAAWLVLSRYTELSS